MSPLRILVADSHPVTRIGLRTSLAHRPDLAIVGEAQDGEEALRLVDCLKPEVLVLDLQLSQCTGMEVAHRLATARAPVPILVFTTDVTAAWVRHLPTRNVAGYLTKEEPVAHVIQALQGIARGEWGWYSASVQHQRQRLQAAPPERQRGLTARELEVLRELMRGDTYQEISRTLAVSTKTVDVHLMNIYRKLQVSGRTEAALFALTPDLVSLV